MGARIAEHQSGLSAAEVARTAESLAYDGRHSLTEPGDVAAAAVLCRAGIATNGPAGFQFRSPTLQVHLAAAYLCRNTAELDFREILHSAHQHGALVAALRSGSVVLRTRLVRAATELLLVEAMSDTRLLIADLPIELERAKSVIVAGHFKWTGDARRILRVLQEGLRYKPEVSGEALPNLTAAIVNRFILAALIGGGLTAKEDAADLLPLASVELALPLCQFMLSDKYQDDDNLRERVVRQLKIRSWREPKAPGRTRTACREG